LSSAIRVEANGPWDHRAALAHLAAHATAGIERPGTGEGGHVRSFVIGGEALAVEVELDADGVAFDAGTGDRSLNEALAVRVRHWFDLDADTAAIDEAFRGDELLGAQVIDRPGIRVTRFADGYEAAALTVMGQQVTLTAARGFGARLVAGYGEPGPDGLKLFPRPEMVATEDPETLRALLRTTGARARTLQAVSSLFAEGFRIEPETDPEEARRELLSVTGIGPWTADYLSIRALADPDRLPLADAVIRRALEGLDESATVAASERWSPWRSYASMRLWAGQSTN